MNSATSNHARTRCTINHEDQVSWNNASAIRFIGPQDLPLDLTIMVCRLPRQSPNDLTIMVCRLPRQSPNDLTLYHCEAWRMTANHACTPGQTSGLV